MDPGSCRQHRDPPLRGSGCWTGPTQGNSSGVRGFKYKSSVDHICVLGSCSRIQNTLHILSHAQDLQVLLEPEGAWRILEDPGGSQERWPHLTEHSGRETPDLLQQNIQALLIHLLAVQAVQLLSPILTLLKTESCCFKTGAETVLLRSLGRILLVHHWWTRTSAAVQEGRRRSRTQEKFCETQLRPG